jgi:hypothetical protein
MISAFLTGILRWFVEEDACVTYHMKINLHIGAVMVMTARIQQSRHFLRVFAHSLPPSLIRDLVLGSEKLIVK